MFDNIPKKSRKFTIAFLTGILLVAHLNSCVPSARGGSLLLSEMLAKESTMAIRNSYELNETRYLYSGTNTAINPGDIYYINTGKTDRTYGTSVYDASTTNSSYKTQPLKTIDITSSRLIWDKQNMFNLDKHCLNEIAKNIEEADLNYSTSFYQKSPTHKTINWENQK